MDDHRMSAQQVGDKLLDRSEVTSPNKIFTCLEEYTCCVSLTNWEICVILPVLYQFRSGWPGCISRFRAFVAQIILCALVCFAISVVKFSIKPAQSHTIISSTTLQETTETVNH